MFYAFVQRLCAQSDTNGNPRRIFQVVRSELADPYSHKGIVKANAPVEYYDEGYQGADVVPHDENHVYINMPDVAVTVAAYNKLLPLAKPS